MSGRLAGDQPRGLRSPSGAICRVAWGCDSHRVDIFSIRERFDETARKGPFASVLAMWRRDHVLLMPDGLHRELASAGRCSGAKCGRDDSSPELVRRMPCGFAEPVVVAN